MPADLPGRAWRRLTYPAGPGVGCPTRWALTHPGASGRPGGRPEGLSAGEAGLAWGEQPGLEQAAQVLVRDALRQRDELRRGPVPVPVLRRPAAQHGEERTVTDPVAQDLQRHGAPVVGRRAEDVRRAAGVAGRRRPQVLVGGGRRVQPVEELLGRAPAGVLRPEPLRVRREALVEPDVLP